LKPASGVLTLDRALKRGIGYLPQQTAAQKNFPAGVEEVVLSGFIGRRAPLPFYTASEKRTARLHMETLGVAGSKRCFGELSGGQQRRVLLARALCATETMLVLDEPAAGLDPPAAKALYALLDQINRTRYITIIMVTHDITSALESAGKVLHLQGRQLFFGRTSEYAESGPGRLFLGGKQ
jgi:zinc transport system ATP-binding protein